LHSETVIFVLIFKFRLTELGRHLQPPDTLYRF